jgi:hypothetical protein
MYHAVGQKNDQAAVPEIIDPVFAKTSQNARFLLSENERFGLVFVKTGSINSGTGEEMDHSEGQKLDLAAGKEMDKAVGQENDLAAGL